MKNAFDVIIIGAGVAGCHLGSLLASQGVKTLLIEKSRKVKRDSGIVSKDIEKFVRLDKSLIKLKIKRMKFVSPSGKFFTLNSGEPFAYLLNREKFGKHMRNLARSSGAKIIYADCSAVDYAKNFVEAVADGKKYYAKIVVGCDGAGSVVRKSLAIKSPKIFYGVMSSGEPAKKSSDIEIHFNKFCSPHFFSWSIPQAKEAGIIVKKDPVEYMRYFIKRIGFSAKKSFMSPIPIGHVKSFGERALLVGDSCGQVKPVSGGGIIYSLRCSEIAAKFIKIAIEKNDFSEPFLKGYEKSWKKQLLADIRLQMLCRNLYRKMSNKDIDDLFSIIGSEIENISDFEYDKLSTIIWKLPKKTILKCAVRYIPLMFEWSHD